MPESGEVLPQATQKHCQGVTALFVPFLFSVARSLQSVVPPLDEDQRLAELREVLGMVRPQIFYLPRKVGLTFDLKRPSQILGKAAQDNQASGNYAQCH